MVTQTWKYFPLLVPANRNRALSRVECINEVNWPSLRGRESTGLADNGASTSCDGSRVDTKLHSVISCRKKDNRKVN